MAFKKGDCVKIVKTFEGFKQYGIRKGVLGIVVRKSKFRGMPALQVEFPKSGKELSIFPSELKKISKHRC